MFKLTATSSVTLDTTLFRSQALNGRDLDDWECAVQEEDEVPRFDLHPALEQTGRLFRIDLETTWDDLRFVIGPRGILLSELGERKENATMPGIAQICVTLWVVGLQLCSGAVRQSLFVRTHRTPRVLGRR